MYGGVCTAECGSIYVLSALVCETMSANPHAVSCVSCGALGCPGLDLSWSWPSGAAAASWAWDRALPGQSTLEKVLELLYLQGGPSTVRSPDAGTGEHEKAVPWPTKLGVVRADDRAQFRHRDC